MFDLRSHQTQVGSGDYNYKGGFIDWPTCNLIDLPNCIDCYYIFIHIGTSRRFWVAETKALELSCRFRHSGRISDTYTDPIQWLGYSKKTHEILEIWFWNRHIWFKKTKKPQKPTELALNFPKNQKLLKSVHGARRTVVPNAISLRWGVPTDRPDPALSNFRRQLMYHLRVTKIGTDLRY